MSADASGSKPLPLASAAGAASRWGRARGTAGKCPCCGRHAVRPLAQPGRVCRYRNAALTLPDDLQVPTCRRCKHMLLSFESVPELAAALEATYRAELVQRAAVEIKARDRLFAGGVPSSYATWLGGPIWRHCKDVERVDFHWRLETRCPVPGSYALHAVATVKSSRCADRQFSLFRMGRDDSTQLARCLSELGWNEVAMVSYGGEHSLRLYRKRVDGPPEAGR